MSLITGHYDTISNLYGRLKQQFFSPAYQSAFRSAGTIAATYYIVTNASRWFQKAYIISPFLGINVVIIVTFIQLQLLKRYHRDVSVTLFRTAVGTVRAVRAFGFEYLSMYDVTDDSLDMERRLRRRQNRKLVRIAVMFLMMQHCLLPLHHLVWLHSLLAYKFLMDLLALVTTDLYSQLWSTSSAEARLSAQEPGNSTQQQQLSSRTKLAVSLAKAIFTFAVMYQQTCHVSKVYVSLTLLYFVLCQKYLERHLTRALEHVQMEVFEGLEQYYVQGGLGVLEILFAVVFMLWTLIIHKQFLMLAALYTNVYSGGRELINSVVSAAFSEWTVLASFPRATKEELEALDDVCAICLSTMRVARKLPCRHFFHGHCLRRCLKERTTCPICSMKFNFK